MEIISIKTDLFREGDDLFTFIQGSLPTINNKDILAVTSKIVALSQRRVAHLKDKERIIKQESRKVIPTPWGYLTYTSEGWCINAGIDESNTEKEKMILMPRDIFSVAKTLRKQLKTFAEVEELGIVITDTRTIPLRAGTLGRAIGYAGFEPFKSYVDIPDLHGRRSRLTQSNVADSLAASAVLTMGEGAERSPLAIVRSAPVVFTKDQDAEDPQETDLVFQPEDDIYKAVYAEPEYDLPGKQTNQ
ncbi:MAG: coenzyme F420-0:L-glutamate ligase [Candidatus Paceibacterota bacterium]